MKRKNLDSNNKKTIVCPLCNTEFEANEENKYPFLLQKNHELIPVCSWKCMYSYIKTQESLKNVANNDKKTKKEGSKK